MPKRVDLYLSEIQIKNLKTMSKRMDLSVSEIVRRAIDEYWERFERKGRGKG
jgi:Ribbon-helix-helix protein, copG family